MYYPQEEFREYGNYKNNRPFTIRIHTLIAFLLIIILILPSAVFSLGSVYESLTPGAISYNWLNYEFGILQLVILVIGILEIICQRQGVAVIIFSIALIREIFLFFVYDNSIFTDSAYEMYLTILVGYSLFLIARRYLNKFKLLDKFYGLFLITNMITIYINVAMGGRGTTSTEAELAHIEGRYHASNLDVGGTGTLCLLCIIYLYFSEMKNVYRYPLILLSIIGLILSGSRSAVVFIIILMGYYLLKSLLQSLKKSTMKVHITTLYKIIVAVVLGSIIAIFAFSNLSFIFTHIDLQRFEALLSVASASSDSSVQGRFTSIADAIDIIINNPLGISGYFVNLQTEMIMRGFPTFPHSSLLSNYILFGPIIFGVYFIWGYFLGKEKKYNNKYFWIILYYTVSTIAFGGPTVNFKVIFAMILSTYLAFKSLRNEER